MPLVTIGIPFFNEAKNLGDAIRSVLAQSFTDFELLLADDGSRDESLLIARSFRDPRITVLTDGQRRHLPARLNQINARARGRFIARADADDVMHPTRLARQLAMFEAQPSLDVIGTWIILIDGNGEPFAVIENTPLPPTPKSALILGVLPHPTVMGRSAWFRANPYNETLTRAEDRDLWCRTVTNSQFAVVPECLYAFRVDVAKATFLASYVEGQRQNRLLLAEYGPAFVGRLESARLAAVSEAKALVMRTLMRTGFADRLVRRRGRPPKPHELALAREALLSARTGARSS